MRFDYIKLAAWPDVGWRILWQIDGVEVGDTIRIEKSQGPEGPWIEVVNSLPYNSVIYEDDEFGIQGAFMLIWYRVIVVRGGSDVLVSKPIDATHASTKVTNEIIRQHDLLLRGVNGHPGFLSTYLACYKKTKYGLRFEESRAMTGEKLLGGSAPDGNTGFQAGWSEPVLFKGRWIDQNQKSRQMQPLGMREDNTRQLWMSNYPILEPGDVLCEKGTGIVFEVRNITASDPGGIIVSQRAMCTQIDYDAYESNNLYYPGDEPA